LLTSGIITVELLVGTPEGDQLPAVAQSVEVAPVHVEVDCAKRLGQRSPNKIVSKKEKFFMNLRCLNENGLKKNEA
jgi:hypothetical protein